MNLTINGESQALPDTLSTVQDLLEYLKIQDRIVVVEINRNILQKEDHGNTPVSDRDTIELVHFVGGG
ncbi:MAG TPA: thiamine biosynthesis protein ThiS [Paenibacillaceae bacterium]|nr:thiamine biosynthesis protein ThiS [Paenibacillaceae bacterium]